MPRSAMAATGPLGHDPAPEHPTSLTSTTTCPPIPSHRVDPGPQTTASTVTRRSRGSAGVGGEPAGVGAGRREELRGNCRHAKGRTRAPDVAGADERASRSRILALWEDRSAPHPAAATRKPRNRAEASGRVQRGGANDPPRAPFLRPAPRGPAGAFPTDSFGGARGCRDARPTGSPSGRPVGITTTPRDLTAALTAAPRRARNYHHAKGLDPKGRTRPPPQGFVQIPVVVRGASTTLFPFTTPLHLPLYEKKRRSGE